MAPENLCFDASSTYPATRAGTETTSWKDIEEPGSPIASLGFAGERSDKYRTPPRNGRRATAPAIFASSAGAAASIVGAHFGSRVPRFSGVCQPTRYDPTAPKE